MGEPLGDGTVIRWLLADDGEGVCASEVELSELDEELDERENERPLREVVLIAMGSERFT